jgi:predicted porin
MYKNNGLKLALGYEDRSLGYFGPAITGWDDKKYFVGAGYSMNNIDLAIGYQDRDLDARNVGNFDNINMTSWAIAAAYNFGNNKVIASYGVFDADETSNVPAGYRRNWKADSFALGVEHKFSKRTKAYVIYATSELGIGGAANNLVSPAITSTLGNAPARKGKAGSVGMIHNF